MHLTTRRTEEVPEPQLAEVRVLLDRAFDDFTDEDWQCEERSGDDW